MQVEVSIAQLKMPNGDVFAKAPTGRTQKLAPGEHELIEAQIDVNQSFELAFHGIGQLTSEYLSFGELQPVCFSLLFKDGSCILYFYFHKSHRLLRRKDLLAYSLKGIIGGLAATV